MANSFGQIGKPTVELSTHLPVLAYPVNYVSGDRKLVMTNAAPRRMTLYQNDVTLVEFSLPGGFALQPALLGVMQSEIYLRFQNTVSRQQDSIAGVVTSMSFSKMLDEGNQAEMSIMFSGIGSRDKLVRISKDLHTSNLLESVNANTEQVTVKNTQGDIVGLASGPTTVDMAPCERVRKFSRSSESVDRYVHTLTKEMVTYFSRESESTEAFKKLLDLFNIEQIVSGLRDMEVKSNEAEILKREEERVAAVLSSMSRRRVIRIRRSG